MALKELQQILKSTNCIRIYIEYTPNWRNCGLQHDCRSDRVNEWSIGRTLFVVATSVLLALRRSEEGPLVVPMCTLCFQNVRSKLSAGILDGASSSLCI